MDGRAARHACAATMAATALGMFVAACETIEAPRPLSEAAISMSVAELEDARVVEPDNAVYLLELGDRYRRLNQLDDAAARFGDALALDGSSVRARALSGLGLTAQSRDDLDEAADLFAQALAVSEAAGLDGLAAEQHLRLGTLARAQGDYVAACQSYARAGARAEAAAFAEEIGCSDPRELLELRAAIRRARTSPTMEGLAQEAAGAREALGRAEEGYARGDVEADALAAATARYSALALGAEGPEAAEAAARRALELDPQLPMGSLLLVIPLILQDRMDEADAALDAGLDVSARPPFDGDNPYALFQREAWAATVDGEEPDERIVAALVRVSERLDDLPERSSR